MRISPPLECISVFFGYSACVPVFPCIPPVSPYIYIPISIYI